MKTFVKHFESPSEMLTYLDANSTRTSRKGFGLADTFTKSQFLAGDMVLVKEAEAYIEQLETVLPDTLKGEWHSDVFGPVISIPDYLASSPVPFQRMREIESSCAPVRVVVSLTSSGGIRPEVLRKRGVVILALLMKIQAVRPVDLLLHCEMDCDGYERGCGIVSLKVESKPLSVAHALNALANANVARQIMYPCIEAEAEIQNLGGNVGGWPEGFRERATYNMMVKKLMGLNENDIYVPATYITDPVTQNPLGWLQENLKNMIHFEE